MLSQIATMPSSVIDARRLLDSVHDPVLIFDPRDEVVLDVNDRACETYGLSRDEFIGLSLLTLSKCVVTGARHVAETLRAKGPYRFETVQRRRDGSEMVLEVHALPILWDARQAILSINRDITERVKMLARLEQAAVEWQITVDAIPSALVLVDRDGRILRANAEALETAGVPNLIGSRLADLAHLQPWGHVAEMAGVAIQSRQPVSAQIHDVTGQRTWDLAVMLTSQGDDAHGVVKVRDVTKRLELEASLQRTQNMANVGRLVAGVAHEVRNPLFTISATVDALLSRCPSETDRTCGRLRANLSQEIRRLNFLMNDLLEYAKPPALEMSEDTLDAVLSEATVNMVMTAAAMNTRVANEFPKGTSPVLVDRIRLAQAFHNLIHNAIHYTPAGEAVTIGGREIERDGRRWVVCTIDDRGPGFAPQDLGSLFEPFFSKRAGGTGLGLSIVQRTVELHGGRITAANREGGGARMTVELPALR